jgi:hypothetical protein
LRKASIDARLGRDFAFTSAYGRPRHYHAFQHDPSAGLSAREPRASQSFIVGRRAPAGMFLRRMKLARAGIRSVIVDRLASSFKRVAAISKASRNTAVSTSTSKLTCFGEGGAGTYSDGKLYSARAQAR